MTALLSRPPLVLVTLLLGLGIAIRPTPVRAQAAECCVVPDLNGTALMPPTAGCLYIGSTEIVDGLSSGSTIQVNASFGNFFNVTEGPGGSLSGTVSNYSAVLNFSMTGTGIYSSYNRFISIPLTNPPFSTSQQISWGPRVPFTPAQSFTAELERLQGQVAGDPDFDLLRVTGGTSFGLPSPGQAYVISQFGNWAVGGYFDTWHRIDFVGASTGPFAGLSGSTVRQRRFTMCPQIVVPTQLTTWSAIKALLER